MFESARLKLTMFYLAILLGFSLVLTWGFRAFVTAEFNHANDVQRGAVHAIGERYFGLPDDSNPAPVIPDQNFASIQRAEAARTRNRLTRDVIVLNMGVLVVGAVVSYWYAGRALKPIEEAHEKQKRFTADASHELRTPLATMKVENEVFLRQKTFNEAEARSQVASNLEEVDRLERLATNLLDLNRYENAVLHKQKLNLHDMVKEAAQRTQQHTPSATIFKNTTANVFVLGDQESLTQLVSILLDNAAKYGPKKGTVEISNAAEGNFHVLSVRDHGEGVAADDLPHIFERMYRGDKARSNAVSGHGIGLSLAAEIASANGAMLSASNHAEGGAIFRVSLPKA